LRKICAEIESIARQDIIKIGNPAKINFKDEEELLVCLGV